MFLKNIVVGAIEVLRSYWETPANHHLLAHPRQGTENRNDDEEICDDTTCDHSRMLDRPVSYYVDDLVDKPAAE